MNALHVVHLHNAQEKHLPFLGCVQQLSKTLRFICGGEELNHVVGFFTSAVYFRLVARLAKAERGGREASPVM